ncbi:MAG: GPI anchored serine-threonine rich family protein [Acidobacteria bacterium]|jgi:hypothetical protein|nr:GPI anchored serine-threonine rich family protein [Acidobacteriota bacterium]
MKKKTILGFLSLCILFSIIFAIDPMPPLRVIIVTSPAANAVYSAGQAIAIHWTCKGAVGSTVKIKVVPEIEPQAAQVIIASTANDGAHTWVNAAAFPGKVWIEVQTPDGQVKGKSGLFTISPPVPQWAVYVNRPLANSAYSLGQSVPIAWNCTGTPPASVRIRVVPDAAPQNAQVVSASTANDGSFSWTPEASFQGSVRIEVGSLNGSVTGKSGPFTISAAGTQTYTFPVNRVFHGGAWGEFCDPLQYLGNGFHVHAGSRLTIRRNLAITPAGFQFCTWVIFPNNGCPNPETEGKANGTCWPLTCGSQAATWEHVYTAQEIAESGSLIKLKLHLYGTSRTVADYQISGNVQVTISQ